MRELEQQVIDISYREKLSHIGSSLTALPIIESIYKVKQPHEKFILSSGHAHLAHAVVMSKYQGKDVMDYMKAGIHCDKENGCDVSTGSLGQGLPIAVGLALARRDENVYCLISDGECAEGSIWEALRVANENELSNLHVFCNANGFAGYQEVNAQELCDRLNIFFPVSVVVPEPKYYDEVIKGLEAHYKVLDEEAYGKITAKR